MPSETQREPASQPLNPAAMTISELARALGTPEATIQRHVDQGAPQSGDGRLNLVHYAAWLNKSDAANEAAHG